MGVFGDSNKTKQKPVPAEKKRKRLGNLRIALKTHVHLLAAPFGVYLIVVNFVVLVAFTDVFFFSFVVGFGGSSCSKSWC